MKKVNDKSQSIGNEITFSKYSIELDPFDIEYITLTHSILEPNGLRIKTPAGVILHTGDWKVDPNPLIGDEINSKRLNPLLFFTCPSIYLSSFN